ncbi:MAG: twin-arginine translocase subunit TatC [Crocinitomicaceae bacterium]|nr:twin-arginine translocase subunit TatC [Crocinitomicaceae bacterium]
MSTENQSENASSQEEMSFLEHLEVLRWHIVRSAIAILSLSIIAFLNKSFVFDTFLLGPKKPDFPTFRFLCEFSEWLNGMVPSMVGKDTLCIGQNMPDLQNIHMAGQFTTHIMISLFTGLIVAFPYVFWEIWRFIKPGLKDTESKIARGSVFFTSTLFLSGVCFGYFIISPLSVNFFLNYSVSEQVHTIPTLSTYISTVTTVVLACGFVFQLPIVIYFLTKVGLVGPLSLKKFRRHAFVGCLILSAVITPPDVFSQFLVTLPLIILYEISIYISARVEKEQQS